jgi:hypothetical protein
MRAFRLIADEMKLDPFLREKEKTPVLIGNRL